MLLKTEHKDFKGTDGKQVSYLNAKILDTDGNLYELPVAKEAIESMPEGQSSGYAKIELFVGKTKEGRSVNKLRLLGFEPE